MLHGPLSRLLFLCAVLAPLSACAPVPPPPPEAVFQRTLVAEAETLGLTPFYEERGFTPLWADEERLSDRGQALLDWLASADGDGLYPGDLQVPAIRDELLIEGPESLARAEARLSAGLVRYRTGLGGEGATLRDAAAAEDLPAFLSGLPPWGDEYRRLRSAQAAYRRIAEAGSWPTVEPGPTLREGDQGQRVVNLRARLAATDDLPVEAQASDLFNGALDQAVRRFQARHGLVVDGAVGALTQAALDVPAGERALVLAANLARLRALHPVLTGTGVVVNVAEARLRLVREGQEVLASRVIVGRQGWSTPLFSGVIREIEVNPYWIVPPRIARLEVIPKIRRDPAYLREKNMKVLSGWTEDATEVDPATVDWSAKTPFRLRLRQEPGPRNPLGAVKFLFPNSHHVYLHDTPERRLFERSERALSHGCVRVERAFDLAALLLEGETEWTSWSPQLLAEVIAEGQPLRIRLAHPVPVHLVSLTAWVDTEGITHFRPESCTGEAGETCCDA